MDTLILDFQTPELWENEFLLFLSHPVCLQLAPATLSSPGLQEIILSHFLSCHTCLSFSFSFHLLSLISDKHGHVQGSALRPLLCLRSIPWVASPNPMAFRTTCILRTCKLIRPAQTYSACPLGCLRRNITCQNITRRKPDCCFPSQSCSSNGHPASVKGSPILSAAQDTSLHTNPSANPTVSPSKISTV